MANPTEKRKRIKFCYACLEGILDGEKIQELI